MIRFPEISDLHMGDPKQNIGRFKVQMIDISIFEKFHPMCNIFED